MNYFLFYYTLCNLLVIMMSSAVCLSSYLVSRNKYALLCCGLFLFYFFDIAFVFQNDHLISSSEYFYSIGVPFASMLSGAGLLSCFWLMCCNFLQFKTALIRYIPTALFIIASLVVLECMPLGSIQTFCFYSLRSVFYLSFLIVLFIVGFKNKDPFIQTRIKRYHKLYLCLWIFGWLPLLENIFFLLLIKQETLQSSYFAFLPQRNFAENLLMWVVAFFAVRKNIASLKLRFDKPPTNASECLQEDREQLLLQYAKRHALSQRETEVLSYLLDDKNNQEIATILFLAPSTVKRHVHHILQKTKHSNRQDLIQGFWRHP